jgi:NifU-like protein involved in Fe-S cluster formation
VKGRSLAEARQLRREQLVEAAGSLPPASMHASHLAMDALAALLKTLGHAVGPNNTRPRQ